MSMNITDRDDVTPICPFCNTPINEVYKKSKGLGLLTGKNVVYFCSTCHKVLGFGQSRMA